MSPGIQKGETSLQTRWPELQKLEETESTGASSVVEKGNAGISSIVEEESAGMSSIVEEEGAGMSSIVVGAGASKVVFMAVTSSMNL